MLKKQDNLGQMLMRYWFVIVIALFIFGFISGFIPTQFTKIEHSLRKKDTKTESIADSLYKVEQGKERQEVLKY